MKLGDDVGFRLGSLGRNEQRFGPCPPSKVSGVEGHPCSKRLHDPFLTIQRSLYPQMSPSWEMGSQYDRP